MRRILESATARAGLFFAAGVAVSALLGALVGDVRAGVRSGVLVGLALAAFAYLFVRPAGRDGRDGDG